MLRTPEFWLFVVLTMAGVVAKSSRWGSDSVVHEIAVSALMVIGAVSAWLTQKAREAPSPVQEAVIDSKQAQIDSQARLLETHERVIAAATTVAVAAADCVKKNHPVEGPMGPAGPAGPPGPVGPAGTLTP